MKSAFFKKIMITRILLMGVIATFLVYASFTMAAEKAATKSASPAGSPKSASSSAVVDGEKVKALKDKLATKVAELRENQKRGFFGEIAASAKSSFTLVTDKGEVRIRFTEDTQFFKFGKDKTAIKPEDIKNGLFASVLGLYDEENKQENAKVVLLQNKDKFNAGQVTAIDKDKASITIKNKKGDSLVLDYEKITTADEVATSTKKLAKSGLSRLAVDDRLLVWGTPSEDDNKKISLTRIVRIPQELINPPDPNASPVPSPSVKPTPAATPKTASASASKASPKASTKPSPSVSPKS